MKFAILLIFVISLSVVLVSSKSRSKLAKKIKKKQGDLQPVTIGNNYSSATKQPQHISETFHGGNPNTLPTDRGFLWKGFSKNQFGRPYYHGVVGPQWRVPKGERVERYTHISSPVPHADYTHRVVAHDLPEKTHSHNSFEMPKRRDVVQIDLPASATHVSEMYNDPRIPTKVPVAEVSGTVYHGTGSVSASENMGNNMEPTAENPQTQNSEFSFLENKKHKKHRKNLKARWNKLDDSEVKNLRKASLREAGEAEKKASRLLNSMTPHPEMGDGSMALGIDLKNRRDLHFGLHQNNAALDKTINFWKGQPQGIRAMHTKPFLPPFAKTV